MRAVCAGLRHLPRHLRYVSNVSSLPYRIRAPLARLKESKVEPAEAFRAPALGDGESLETDAKDPDFVALALRSRVYDHLTDTPLQHALALSERLGANVHIKREDLMPTFTFYARCAINQLALIKASAGPQALVTASIGSRGHALAWAAERLGMNLTVVMPLATPTSRREAVSRLGAKVIIHGDSVHDANEEAARLAASQGMIAVGSHDDASVIAATGTVALELLRQHGAADVAAAAALAASVHGRPPSRSVARRSTAMPLDAIFVSVGGGSLLAGVASVIKALSPRTKVTIPKPQRPRHHQYFTRLLVAANTRARVRQVLATTGDRCGASDGRRALAFPSQRPPGHRRWARGRARC